MTDSILIDTPEFKLVQSEFIVRLLVAVGIGLLIGLEREHSAIKENRPGFAGIRTFVLVVLLGFLGAMMVFLFSPWIYFCVLSAIIILTGISYWITSTKGDIGATTEASVLIAFILGSVTFLGYIFISLIITVVVVVMLSAKIRLKTAIGKITAEELYDFIRFAVIALLIVPFLPDVNYGPYGAINPREIGWVILLTSGIGFIGYMLMKFLGTRNGILLSGIIGGLVSSTATTWVFAKKSEQNAAQSLNCAVAILAASTIMMVRVLGWTFIFNPTLFDETFTMQLFIITAGACSTLFFHFKSRKRVDSVTNVRPGKPLDLHGALAFGALYVIILVFVSYGHENLGDHGMLALSAVAGLSDIDAITISVSRFAGTTLDFSIAVNALLIATMSNTVVKLGIGIWAGSAQLRKYLYIGYGIILFAALVALVVVNSSP
ncbi:MAG: MgtC/SapB family protein [Bacteroidetes bacterium]|nr:MgtC/SapB family protein [Bacteroidota bacterium]